MSQARLGNVARRSEDVSAVMEGALRLLETRRGFASRSEFMAACYFEAPLKDKPFYLKMICEYRYGRPSQTIDVNKRVIAMHVIDIGSSPNVSADAIAASDANVIDVGEQGESQAKGQLAVIKDYVAT